MDWQLLLWILGAYLLGSIPFGLLVCKLFHAQDPRVAGSRNIGFTNVLRVSGRKPGFFTLLGDFGKGLLVAWLAQKYMTQEVWVLAITLAVILGHIFSIFLHFKGGKGVATALGGILGLNLTLGIILIGIWGMTVLIFKYSSGGALASFGALPFIGLLRSESGSFMVFAIVVSVCIFWRHQSNIINIVRGRETKVNNLSS